MERNGIETMTGPENTLSRKRSQKEFEELLLRDVLVEMEAGEAEFWEQKAAELAGKPGYTPSPQQRAAFEERLDLEVKQIQEQKRKISQISHLSQTTENHPISQDSQVLRESEESQEAKNLQPSQGMQILQIPEERPRKSRCIWRKVGSIAAVLVLFLFMTMYHTVDAFAAGVDRFIATMVPEDGAEELRIEEKEGGEVELNMADYVGMYMPGWIPRGYSVLDVKKLSNLIMIRYSNRKGDVIVYEVVNNNGSVYVDDEEVKETKVYVLDTWAKVMEAEGSVYVIWEDANYIYRVSGDGNLRDDLIKMVEKSVKVVQEN